MKFGKKDLNSGRQLVKFAMNFQRKWMDLWLTISFCKKLYQKLAIGKRLIFANKLTRDFVVGVHLLALYFVFYTEVTTDVWKK